MGVGLGMDVGVGSGSGLGWGVEVGAAVGSERWSMAVGSTWVGLDVGAGAAELQAAAARRVKRRVGVAKCCVFMVQQIKFTGESPAAFL